MTFFLALLMPTARRLKLKSVSFCFRFRQFHTHVLSAWCAHLVQCLAHRKCSRSTCWFTKWMEVPRRVGVMRKWKGKLSSRVSKTNLWVRGVRILVTFGDSDWKRVTRTLDCANNIFLIDPDSEYWGACTLWKFMGPSIYDLCTFI